MRKDPATAGPLVPVPAAAGIDLLHSRRHYRNLLWLVTAAFFMQALDTTIINAAVPRIAHALAIGPLDMRGALTSYVLALAVFIPAMPWLCDRYGTRRIFAAAIVLFAAGSLLCGLADTLAQLVAARVLQGIGGAALVPVGRYVLVRATDKKAFVQAMSTVASFGLLGSVLGPLLGGLLVQYASWRLIFLINVPMALLGLWLNQREMPDFRLQRPPAFDWTGFALFGAACALLLVAAQQSGHQQVSWLGVALPGALAMASGMAYLRHSRRVAHPISDLALLRRPSVWGSLFGGLVIRLGAGGMPLILVLYLQLGCGWPPALAGLMLLPQALGSITAKWSTTHLLARLGYHRFLLGNTVLVALLLACFAPLQPTASPWLIAGLVFVYGAFMGLQYTSINALIYRDVESRHAGMAASMSSTMQYLSTSFGIAVATVLMELFMRGQRGNPYIGAFHHTVLALALITLAAGPIFHRLRHSETPRPIG